MSKVKTIYVKLKILTSIDLSYFNIFLASFCEIKYEIKLIGDPSVENFADLIKYAWIERL